jgi:hypothetical protein
MLPGLRLFLFALGARGDEGKPPDKKTASRWRVRELVNSIPAFLVRTIGFHQNPAVCNIPDQSLKILTSICLGGYDSFHWIFRK